MVKATTLDKLPQGKASQILYVKHNAKAALRLAEMGLCKGATITVVRQAPMGDPLVVQIKDSQLCIRKSDARTVTVTA